MKERLIIYPLIFCCILSFFCSFIVMRAANAEISIGESSKFKKQEIEKAIDSAKKKFTFIFHDCELTKMYYDEKKSDSYAKSYIESAERQNKTLKEENIIVLYSDFYVGPSGGDGSLNQERIGNGYL